MLKDKVQYDGHLFFFCTTKENNYIPVVYPKGTKDGKQLGWHWEFSGLQNLRHGLIAAFQSG
jgi:hypothetical protein